MATYLAIVTGGAQGIGHAITSAILQSGGKVHFLDIEEELGIKAQAEFDEKYGVGKSKFVMCDVSNREELKEVFIAAKREMGGLNVVCNNAGIHAPVFDRSHWPKVVDVNLTAVIQGTLLGLDLMAVSKGGQGGVVINTSAMAGLRPVPLAPVYSATKHGIIGLSRSLAPMSIADKVRINCVCPDGTNTTLVANSMAELLPVFSVEEIQKILVKHIYQLDLNEETMQAGPDLKGDPADALLRPSEVGEEVFKLIQDDSKNGEALVVSKQLGTYYWQFN